MGQLLQFFELGEQTWHGDQRKAEEAWRTMNLIRAFEEKCIELYKQGLMGGSLHSYIGQEAVATGVCMNLNTDDYITISYRGRGQAIAKGADPYKLFAEMLGRKDGYCKGKGGPMHIACRELGILGANGIVGAGIPIAVGAALTAKNKKTGQIALTFFGDGATNQGAFHEALNLAAVLKLPVVFVCENNLYAEMTPIKHSTLNEDLAERGAAYRIPSIVVDGNDVRAVHEATKTAVDRARSGEGPTLIEAKTYRLVGHMFGDPETYRTKEEVAEWRQKEPIKRFRQVCLDEKLLDEDRLDEIQNQIYKEIDTVAKRAMEADQPGMEEIFTDVY
ncbi:thiamine pyrophosphate-dependent dehydrogenase E1 component subunit alpha [Thermoflavimicrobium dichotomicum]|uniref:Pyruvate dehydrogenase E1 component alpha subunit n=1 Tax=Thermoflavimicrobium dichotomicum TaxID=46223 RepID=A0A1I3QA41_9BACL|nr:thiamine pyrophosphate-dependent dehydrogenase E1 component subunit alpha [Thermoflavimicrobium dichotomicum]SFJ29986.1 pyruvate dehydrogenase E1 component alpha subunit [Thermoflavimicrobium dichotomicum]